jgi:hypothetical protein
METISGILLVLHLIGFAVVFGGALAQLPAVKTGSARITSGMLHASTLLLLTGVLMVGMIYAIGEGKPNNIKIGIKLLVLIGIFVMILLNRKKNPVSGGVLGAIAGMSVVNVAIAVLWN